MDNNENPTWAEQVDKENGPPLIPAAPGNLNKFKETTFNIIMKGRDDQLKNTRPKTIYDLLYNTNPKPISKINSCKKLRSGDFLMNIDIMEKNNVLKMNKIGDIPVLFKEAWDMNNTKVTIFCEDLINYPMNNENNINEELLKDLQQQNSVNIVNAEIITAFHKSANKRVNSKIAIITLEGKIPEIELPHIHLMLNFESLPIKLYIPDPKICKNCWSYDHISTKKFPCPHQKICGNCSENFHLQIVNNKIIGTCTSQPICINCNRYHPAWSRQCPYYLKEKSYMEIATRQRISYNQAKQIKEKKTKTYATAATIPTITTAQPTDDYRQQPNQQQKDHDSDQIANLIAQIKFLTDVVSKLCQINKIIIEDTEESEKDESMDADTENEIISPTPLAPGRVPGLNKDELTRFKANKGNKNKKATFKRAELRREQKMDKKAGSTNHPSKIPKKS